MLTMVAHSARAVLLHLACLGLVMPYAALGICQCARGEGCCSDNAAEDLASCCSAACKPDESKSLQPCCEVRASSEPIASCSVVLNQCCTHCQCSGPAETAIPVARATEAHKELELLASLEAPYFTSVVSDFSAYRSPIQEEGPFAHSALRLHALYQVWLN